MCGHAWDATVLSTVYQLPLPPNLGGTYTSDVLQLTLYVAARDGPSLHRQSQLGFSAEWAFRPYAQVTPHFCCSQVSSKRVIDGVPMHLGYHLLERFCKQLSDLPALLSAAASQVGNKTGGSSDSSQGGASLSVDAAAKGSASGPAGYQGQHSCSSWQQGLALIDPAVLMAEDQSTAERRARLQRQLKQLQGVRKILNNF